LPQGAFSTVGEGGKDEVGAAAIGGLIWKKLCEQGKGVPLDFGAFEYFDEEWRDD
jgi:hypothetical protein